MRRDANQGGRMLPAVKLLLVGLLALSSIPVQAFAEAADETLVVSTSEEEDLAVAEDEKSPILPDIEDESVDEVTESYMDEEDDESAVEDVDGSQLAQEAEPSLESQGGDINRIGLVLGQAVYFSSDTPLAPRVSIYDHTVYLDGGGYKQLEDGVDYTLKGYTKRDGTPLSTAPSEPGDYIAVYEGMGEYTGTAYFNYTILDCTLDSAATVRFGSEYSSSQSAGGKPDIYAIELPSGGNVGLSGTIDGEAHLYLFDPSGILRWQTYGTDMSEMDVTGPNTRGLELLEGCFYLVVDLSDDGNYDITFSFTAIDESFPEVSEGSNDTFEEASAIDLNTEYTGRITLGETIDFYRFSMPSDEQVTLNASVGPDLLLLFTIFDSSQNQVWAKSTYAMTKTSDNAYTVEIDLPAGEYYMRVRFMPMEKTRYGTYTFSLMCDALRPAFKDVSASTPHADDITWLSNSGISTGWTEKDGSKTFRPTNTVIRQDMAAFLFRLAKLWGLVDDSWQPTGSVTFKDVSPATPHYREIMWLAESGISSGWKVGSAREFRPTNTVVRQDMAAFLRRLQALRDPSVKTWEPTGASPFRDVTAKTPHSEDILWLADSGVSAGWKVGGSKEFRPTNTVIRQDMAAFLHRLDSLS